jgi:hypothetical protein
MGLRRRYVLLSWASHELLLLCAEPGCFCFESLTNAMIGCRYDKGKAWITALKWSLDRQFAVRVVLVCLGMNLG